MALAIIDDLSAAANWLLGPEDASAKSPLSGRDRVPSIFPSGQNISLADPVAARPTHLWPRWLFLRALGLIYFSAFYSLIFQIRGLIGPNGILPGRRLSRSGRRCHARVPFLVYAYAILVRIKRPRADASHMGWADRVPSRHLQSVATGGTCGMFRLLPFLRQFGAGFCRIPI